MGRQAGGVIRVGPAGWDYRDWRGPVYPDVMPKGFDPLAFLANFFDVVEVNSTFYRPALPATARRWADRVEAHPNFRFTAKLWRRFTHERDEAFTRADVQSVVKPMAELRDRDRLGALLVQFPWSFKRSDESRAWLDDVTRAFAKFPLVLEVRHESWNVPEFYAELAERKIGFVNIDQPLFARSIKPSATVTAPLGYVRVHGRNYRDWFRKNAGVEARYDYLYSPAELRPWAERAQEVADSAGDTFVVTNNHYRGQAVVNAVMLKSMLEGRPVPAPPQSVAAYSEELAGFAADTDDQGAAAGRASGAGRRHAS